MLVLKARISNLELVLNPAHLPQAQVNIRELKQL
jgi:hypothetical protein